MLKTVTTATFEYRGHKATAHRMIDSLTKKFFCWQGRFDDNKTSWIIGKTLESFEKNFIALADKTEDEPDAEVAPQIEHYGIEPDADAAQGQGG